MRLERPGAQAAAEPDRSAHRTFTARPIFDEAAAFERYENDAQLQQEFLTFTDYSAFAKPHANGRGRIRRRRSTAGEALTARAAPAPHGHQQDDMPKAVDAARPAPQNAPARTREELLAFWNSKPALAYWYDDFEHYHDVCTGRRAAPNRRIVVESAEEREARLVHKGEDR